MKLAKYYWYELKKSINNSLKAINNLVKMGFIAEGFEVEVEVEVEAGGITDIQQRLLVIGAMKLAIMAVEFLRLSSKMMVTGYQ